jgi:stage II sporulation protein D
LSVKIKFALQGSRRKARSGLLFKAGITTGMLILLLSIGCDRGQVDVDDSWRQKDKQIEEKPSKECVVGEVPADRLLRVFLSEESEVSLKGKAPGYGFETASFAIRNAETGEQLSEIPTGESCRISRSGGRWLIKSADGTDVWLGEAWAGCLELEFGIGHEDKNKNTETVCSISSVSAGKTEDWRGYRGSIRLVAWSLERFAVVNDVDIEEYLQGVVGSEVYSSWPDSALEAQSIASRSYASYYKQCRGNSRPESDNYWDIGSDQGSQVYGGVSRENVRISQAVKRTAGVVLAYGPLGQRRLFPAYYSAVCGGHTQDATVVFGDSIEPLSGCECGYCGKVAPKERYRWADVSIAKSVVNSRLVKKYPPLSEIGRIVSISVAERSSYGRATLISLRGAGGRRRLLKAEEFRQAVSSSKEQLLSSWYSIADTGGSWRFENGRGWGHGVGLCQWGSYQMGLEGKSCLDILQYYYRHAALVRAY